MNIYIIMLDGTIFNTDGENRKFNYIYQNRKAAQESIDSVARMYARIMYNEDMTIDKSKDDLNWYQIGEEKKQSWLQLAKDRFFIKEMEV